MGLPLQKRDQRPDVFTYHDIHDFLKDHVEFLKSKEPSFSLRQLALISGLSSGLLPSIFARRTTLSQATLDKLAPHLQLSKPELKFLEWLRQLSEAPTKEEKLKAYRNIRRFGDYQGHNAETIESHQYLHKWYYAVIRELVKLPEFKFDPKWVQKKLNGRISLKETREALKFLQDHKYITVDTNGKAHVSQKKIVCSGGVYKMAMSDYHKQVLNFASDSIYDVPSDFRDLNIYTFAFADDQFHQVKEILAEALNKLVDLKVDDEKKNHVYKACLLAFPITKKDEA